MNRLHLVLFVMYTSQLLLGQVGIGTNTPEGILDVYSTNSGVVLPRNNDPETNVGIASTEGMILYDTTAKTIRFYDGTEWRFVNFGGEDMHNEGVVKVNGYASSGNTVTPSYNLQQDVTETIEYNGALAISSSPTTSWPENIDNPTDADIYDSTNHTFIENTIPGQVTAWRIIFNVVKPNGTVGLKIRLYNPSPLSSFEQVQVLQIPLEVNNETSSVVFYTIADQLSLPAPYGTGMGYKFEVTADNSIISDFEVKSVTRISFQKD